ncbi:hypothetical protein MY5147_002777 [Beauveria neobassiana]|uniref:alcohol O-acetyltransferase n=3 Tax=Beauveria bassiana TaxID=176275 RepID=J4KQ36_BEAB2|nr:hydrolase, alpha/beta fold family [Beauveria bassiana ARSEF 2860]EJP68519.1 hydrolase, alpha/beta fold family [Beauveria bassiana ARSEF 2860]KAH8710851.1 putative esterase [Beauveria bassiana]KGQ10161.1 Putative esterase [Beauveria bassiana D1-5]PQK15021.1 hypothetical protein BB8028_0005g05380 [Beauveria bassiana]
MEWFGKAKIEFTHSPAPRAIKQKDGKDTDLLKICEATTPPCHLNPLLFNGHVQTMWTATKPSGPQVFYRRRLFDADHDTYKGSYAVDFAVEPFEESDPTLPHRTVYFTEEEEKNLGSDDARPMVVVLHGLSGGSHEIYLRHTIAPLLGQGGWEACVVNSRGCARSKITSGVLYNARATWDVRQTIKWLREKFPNRPLFGLGFSLGANMMTNYCAEEGESCVLKAAVVCSNPFNLDCASKLMQSTFIGRELYLRVMGSSMKQLIANHKEEIKKHTNLDLEAIKRITYLHDFDREVQCPTWGYPTESAYYRDASSCDSVLSIRIPFLAVNAKDDPIAVGAALPYQEFRQNPNTILLTTSLGGHLCWFEWGGTRWLTKPVNNFLNHMAFEVDFDSAKPTKDAQGDQGPIAFDPMRRRLYVPQM